MVEIIARIAQGEKIELTIDGAKKIDGVESLSPNDAIYLARGLIACALAVESGEGSVGAIIGDAHIPILTWAVGTSELAKAPSLQLGMLHGVELTFLFTEAGAEKLGAALIARGQNKSTPEKVRGTIH
jgi:hypothetical protein